MSRSTQYIGLIRQAYNFLSDYQKIKEGVNCTYGMFDENIQLGEWVDPSIAREGDRLVGDRKFAYIKEVLQDSPWSSGPMLFTCLHGYFHNDPEKKNPVPMFQWVVDPRQEGEYNVEKGTYWV